MWMPLTLSIKEVLIQHKGSHKSNVIPCIALLNTLLDKIIYQICIILCFWGIINLLLPVKLHCSRCDKAQSCNSFLKQIIRHSSLYQRNEGNIHVQVYAESKAMCLLALTNTNYQKKVFLNQYIKLKVVDSKQDVFNSGCIVLWKKNIKKRSLSKDRRPEGKLSQCVTSTML